MSNYKGHINGASFFSVLYIGLLGYVLGQNQTLDHFTTYELTGYACGMFLLGVLFGLWPDVDTNSKGQKIFYTVFFVLDIGFIATKQFEASAYLGLFAILPTLSKHRGWTHTWWAMLLIPSPLLLLPMFFMPERPLSGLFFYGAAVVGYFSHLFMDGLIIKWKKRKKPKPQSD